MDISVIMIDGEFRENTFGAEFFSNQDFPADRFEVIWVEFYSKAPEHVRAQKNVKVITLNNAKETVYHSSYCFNKGIEIATGTVLVIPDADQIVRPNFLTEIFTIHQQFEKLAMYVYRFDEVKKGELKSLDFDELEKKCVLKNPMNYGGCLTVKKKWLMEINGYEQHKIFESGFHANGSDVYTRLKNLGLAIMWSTDLKLFHPWHENTLAPADQYYIQQELIAWRFKNRETKTINGIDKKNNSNHFNEELFLKNFAEKSKIKSVTTEKLLTKPGFIKRILKKLW